MIPLHYYLVLSALVFGIGAAGVLTTRNGIKLLMCIELMLNAANINLVSPFLEVSGARQEFITHCVQSFLELSVQLQCQIAAVSTANQVT